MPAWWRAFLFQTLNGRQLSVYLYLVMLMDGGTACSPTVEEIAKDLGLMSTTQVFEAINVLENYGFILRSRTTPANGRTRRNIYQRPSCEYTILRLLEDGRVDESSFDDGLRSLLGKRYGFYAIAPLEEKRATLIASLQEILNEMQTLSA